MKILYVATVRSHIGQFHMPVIKVLARNGHEVHAAFKDNSADKPGLDLSVINKTFEVPFERSPYSLKNIPALFALKRIIDSDSYDIIHCHTPMGAVLTRIAAVKARKKGTKVIYTAHGFHFYKGASKKNWLLFLPVEKFLSKYTDVLITINEEDFSVAKEKNFKAKKILRINGVGVDLSKFSPITEEEHIKAREQLGLDKDTFIMLYAADLSERKNQPMIFRSLARLKDYDKKIKVLMPGQPILKEEYEKKCDELGISEMVEFMGYRRDIDKLLAACDAVISSSRQEGLPINLIEAAARGRYIIASDVRGNSDVVRQSGYGVTVALNDDGAMAAEIIKAADMKVKARQDVSSVSVYDEKNIVDSVLKIYESV